MPTAPIPEGQPNHCYLCKRDVVVEPSPDAACSACGNLLWFPEPGVFLYKSVDLSNLNGEFENWVGRLPGEELVIDLRDVDLVGSSQLGKLISLHRKAQTRGLRIKLRNLKPIVREVFQITKLETLFPIEES